MHKREIIIIVMFLFLVIFIGSLYFTNYNNITGAVVKEEQPEVYGTYSIKPSFKVSVDYDLEEYDVVVKKTKNLFGECSNHYNLEKCINNKIDEFNKGKKFIWSLDCETEEEKFFYDFVEKYRQCHDSSEKEGICEFELEKGPKNDHYLMKISNINKKTKFELITKAAEGGIHLEEFTDIERIYISNEVNAEGDANQVYQSTVEINTFFDEDGKAKTMKAVAKDINNNEISFETKDKLPLYKVTKNNVIYLSFANPKVYDSLKDSKGIFKPIKDTFKFCVKSDKQFYVYDEKNKKTELKNIEYKFALKFVDKVAPPPIKGINITDKLKDENSVLILWNESPANDVKEYVIYYSENDFKSLEIKDINSDENIKKIKILENKKVEIENIDLENCEFKEESKPCIYGKYEKPLEKDKFYYLKNKDKYLYVLGDLEDNQEYNFMIIAVDYNGNVIDNKEQKFIEEGELPSGRSIDDLKPSYINTIEKKTSEGIEFTLSWNRTVYNLDGSIAYDITSFNIYYKVKDIGDFDELDKFGILINIKESPLYAEPTLFKLNDVPLTTEQLGCESILVEKCKYTVSEEFELGKLYLWGVTALDEAGNEYEKVFVRYFD